VTGGEVRRIEMEVASTKAAATAGVLAEMRGLLEGEFFRKWRGQVVLEEEGVRGVAKEAVPVPTDIDKYISLR
jgi:hypothetical protein